VIILLRLSGSLQFLEWVTFDSFVGARPLEPIDQRVVIVGINEEDIQQINDYPIARSRNCQTAKDVAEIPA